MLVKFLYGDKLRAAVTVLFSVAHAEPEHIVLQQGLCKTFDGLEVLVLAFLGALYTLLTAVIIPIMGEPHSAEYSPRRRGNRNIPEPTPQPHDEQRRVRKNKLYLGHCILI